MGEMLTMKAAAEACGIDRATVTRWANEGRIKNVERRIALVDVDEVRELAAGITVGRGHKKTRTARRPRKAK